MFLKLCKYELKSISRILLSIYLAVIVLSVVNGISASINGWASHHTDGFSRFIQIYHSSPLFHNSFAQILQNSAWIAYFVLIFALFIVTLILVVQRFYHGLLCREGYMMFSLPVPVWQLIASKAVVGLIMALISSITVFASIFILMMSADPMEFVRALLHVPFVAAADAGSDCADDFGNAPSIIPYLCCAGARSSVQETPFTDGFRRLYCAFDCHQHHTGRVC